MENNTLLLNKINKQKNIIIVLSIFLGFFIFWTAFISITNLLEQKTITFKLKDCYKVTNSIQTCYKIEAVCSQNQTISIQDFSYKNNNKQIVVSRIIYEDKEYTNDDEFVLKKYNTNTLTIYITLNNIEPNTIYFKFNAIVLNNTTNVYNF